MFDWWCSCCSCVKAGEKCIATRESSEHLKSLMQQALSLQKGTEHVSATDVTPSTRVHTLLWHKVQVWLSGLFLPSVLFCFSQFYTSSHLMILQQLNVACEIVQLRWRSNWSLIGYLECKSVVWQLFWMCVCFFSVASRNLLTWGLEVKKGAITRKWCKLQMSVFWIIDAFTKIV